MLARNFAETFPQLDGVRFSHRWAGAIDTSSRFCVTFGKALGGARPGVVGYTGLGSAPAASARVALDLVHGRHTELTWIELVRSRPFPFLPEPLRYAVVQAGTRRALAHADERGGRRGPWLEAAGPRGRRLRQLTSCWAMAEYRPKNRGLERVLGTGALFSTAYGNAARSTTRSASWRSTPSA